MMTPQEEKEFRDVIMDSVSIKNLDSDTYFASAEIAMSPIINCVNDMLAAKDAEIARLQARQITPLVAYKIDEDGHSLFTGWGMNARATKDFASFSWGDGTGAYYFSSVERLRGFIALVLALLVVMEDQS